MKYLVKITYLRPGYDKIVYLLLPVLIVGLVFDAVMEFQLRSWTFVFIKNIINILLIVLVFLLFRLKALTKIRAISISVYSILIGIMISLPFRVFGPGSPFEPYFLKIQMLTIILLMCIGVLVHPKHKLYIMLLDAAFVIYCAIFLNDLYPVGKMAFYYLVVLGSGAVGYYIHETFLRLSSELNEANKTIKLQNGKLKELNESKDYLFHIIGHDLKTPFVQINSLAHLLSQNNFESEEREQWMGMLREVSKKGNELLTGIIDWANTQSLDVLIDKKDVQLSELISSVFEIMAANGHFKKIALRSEVEQNAVIYADSRIVETILRNLISNSLKFSYKGSEIVVRGVQVEGNFRLSVTDKGTGMSKETIKGLFQTAKVDSREGTAEEQGTGFGLNICKRLAENMGARLEIESVEEVGTTVTIVIPERSSSANGM